MVTRWENAPLALDMIEQAFEIADWPDDMHSYMTDLNQMAFSHIVLGNPEKASEFLDLMFSVIETSPETRPFLPRVLANAAWVAGLQGHLVEAEALGRDGLEAAFEFGLSEPKIFAYRALGEVTLVRNNHQLAAEYFQQALRVVYLTGSQLWEGFCYAELARVAAETGNARRAAVLFGAAAANWDQVGIAPSSRDTMVSWGHNGSPSPDDLADPMFAALFAGSRLTRAEAYAEAMKDTSVWQELLRSDDPPESPGTPPLCN